MVETQEVDAELAARLREGVRLANIPTLIPVLVQLTGDERWIAEPYRARPARGFDDNDTGRLPPEIQSEIREAATEAILAWCNGKPPAIEEPDAAQMVQLLAAAVAEPVPDEYGPMLSAEMVRADANDPRPKFEHVSAVIIGAGVSGLCAAIELDKLGVDTQILERNVGLGGTWFENAYPGAGVDTPSHLYELAAAPNDWPHYFATQSEVRGYLERVADDFALRPKIRFATEVTSAVFDEGAQRWVVTTRTSDGEVHHLQADTVVSAVGAFNRPTIPSIPGLDTFPGPAFHPARWPDVDLTGKRVAVVGNGATAMQLVPAIVDRVRSLTVYQRSPHWIAPFEKLHRPVPEPVRFLMRAVPLYRSWYRARLGWTYNDKLHATLQRDPDWPHPDRAVNAVNDRHREYFTAYIEKELEGRDDLIEAVLPKYPPYGKRILMDNGWYRALRQPHVELVTDPVERIDGDRVVTAGGASRDADVLILATGFDVVNFLSTIDVRGRDGIRLADVWADGDARAYLGTLIPRFPNFFVLYGPNTQPGHGGSLIAAVEAQMHMVAGLLRLSAGAAARSVEISDTVFEEFNSRVDALHEQMVWTHPGMDTYYRNAAGRVVVNSPFRIVDFWHHTHELDPTHFVLDHEEGPS